MDVSNYLNISSAFEGDLSSSEVDDPLSTEGSFPLLGSSDWSLISNMSLNGTDHEGNPFLMAWWKKSLWFILFGGMVIVATGGNLIVIWIVLTEKRMRTITNIFLVNLSIADTMVSTLNVIFNSISMVSNHWPFGRIYCKMSQFVALLSISASVFTLMAISMDRYLAIMHPLRPRLGTKATVCIVIGIWAASSGVAAPHFIVFTTESIAEGDSIRVMCYGKWPDGEQSESQMEYIHSIVVIILTYVLPMMSMGFTYTRMGLMLWGSRGIGEPIPNHAEALKSKRKVVKMMIVVVTIFGVCWLPYHMYFILYTQIPEINTFDYIQDVFLGIYWLAMSNSMYNPMIYCWLNSRFRNGFKRVLSPWFPCIRPPDLGENRRGHTIHTNVFSSTMGPDAVNRISNDGVNLRGFYRNAPTRCPSALSSCPSVSPTPGGGLRSNSSSRSNTTTRSTLNGKDSIRLGAAPQNGLQVDTSKNSLPRASTPV